MPLSIKANIDLLNPKRTVAELKELRALTSDANGAQRVAFTPKWVEARTWLRKKLEPLPVEIHNDAAGNTWTTLRGDSERALLIGDADDDDAVGAIPRRVVVLAGRGQLALQILQRPGQPGGRDLQ